MRHTLWEAVGAKTAAASLSNHVYSTRDHVEESTNTMKRLAGIGALGLLASCLYAQGLNTGGQNKASWEEVNFEFTASILSDGYPSLLRLGDLLSHTRDYRVHVTG